MDIQLTYDIKATSSTIHAELKEKLKTKYQFADVIKAQTGPWYSLPNTTLRKGNSSALQGSADFLQACREVGATWEKYIVVEYSVARFDNQ